jgi:exonuclease SbcD
MRILHTADWHLGKIVNEFSMLALQEEYLKELVAQTKKLELDALIVAGDLYDRAIPPKEAVSLANRVFTKLTQEVGVPVLVIAGNHDSNERIEYGAELLASSDLYIEGTTKEAVRKVTIKDSHFYLVPYDDHRNIRGVLKDETIRTPEDALKAQLSQVKEDWDPDAINILLYHGFIINQSTDQVLEESDSERALNVGTVDFVPAELVEAFDYVALGHLHKAQKVKSDFIRYSGSPLKYSKSEANHRKQNLLVEVSKEGVQVDPIEIQPSKDLRVVRGLFEDILKETSEDYLFFELEDQEYILDAMNRLRRNYPYAMGLEYIHHKKQEQLDVYHSKEHLETKSSQSLFADFYEQHRGMPLNDDQQQAVVETFEEIEAEEKM